MVYVVKTPATQFCAKKQLLGKGNHKAWTQDSVNALIAHGLSSEEGVI